MEKLKIKFLTIKEEDLEMIMNWRMQPDITRYMNTDPKLTIEDQKRWYEKIKKSDDFYWIIAVDGIKVGVASLVNWDKNNRRIYTGVYIAVKEKRSLRLILDVQWNLYQYAFDTLKCNKVCEEVFSCNKAVLRILDLCGSKVEAVLRQHILKNNKYYDVTVRGILESEWREKTQELKYNYAKFE